MAVTPFSTVSMPFSMPSSILPGILVGSSTRRRKRRKRRLGSLADCGDAAEGLVLLTVAEESAALASTTGDVRDGAAASLWSAR